MIDERRIAEIEDRLSKATPGPWHYEYTQTSRGVPCITVFAAPLDMFGQPMSQSVKIISACNSGPFPKDAALITNAPTDQRYLLDLVKSLREELTRERTKSRDMERTRR